jgi:hypothetical protein
MDDCDNVRTDGCLDVGALSVSVIQGSSDSALSARPPTRVRAGCRHSHPTGTYLTCAAGSSAKVAVMIMVDATPAITSGLKLLRRSAQNVAMSTVTLGNANMATLSINPVAVKLLATDGRCRAWQ